MSEMDQKIFLADQFKVAASNGRYLEEFCKDRNIDLRVIATSLDIDINTFQDFETRISLDKFCRLFESIAILSSDDLIGLRYGLAYKLGGTGPFGYGMSNAPSFKEALLFCAKYFRLSADLDRFDLFIPDSQLFMVT